MNFSFKNPRSSEPPANLSAPMIHVQADPASRATGETTPPRTPAATIALDSRQDELMAIESVDGIPPSHQQRMTGWRWVWIIMPIAIVAAVAWALIQRATLGAVVGVGAALALLLVMGGWPVLASTLLRGGEERKARREATDEFPHERERRQPMEALTPRDQHPNVPTRFVPTNDTPNDAVSVVQTPARPVQQS